MLTAEGFMDVILILISVVALVWLFSGPWSSLLVDVWRQTCFEQRDRLFLLALDGHIGFDDPLYRRTRSWLNACINRAHEMSFWNLMVAAVAYKPNPNPRNDLYTEICEMGDGPIKTEMLDIVKETVEGLVESIFARSPLLLAVAAILTPLLFLVFLVGFVSGQFRNIVTRLRSWPRRMLYNYDLSASV